MLLLWALVLGLTVGFLRGGSIANLDYLEIRHSWLVFLALVIQLLIFPSFTSEPAVRVGTPYFYVASYGILALFVLFNLRTWQIAFMGFGMGSNFLVIVVNGGYMPASVGSLRHAGNNAVADSLLNEEICGNVIRMTNSTHLNFLGDWLYLPDWMPLSTAFSLGDLLIGLGLIAFFGLGMVSKQ